MNPNSKRDQILDAALAVISRAGACRLTLDAVAEEAKVSKGGLLYHFPDKEVLLRALLDRHLDRRKAWMEGAHPGNTVADLVHARVDVVRMPETSPAAMPLLGILALEPKLLARTQAENTEFINRLRADPSRFLKGLVVSLASTGLIVSEALGSLSLSPAERDTLLTELHRLADQL